MTRLFRFTILQMLIPAASISVPPGFRAAANGATLHHGELAEVDVWDRGGYRITTTFQTALDVASGELSLEQLTLVVRNVCEPAPTTVPQELRNAAERIGHRAALRMERAPQGADLL